jgi:hypothetical protein
MVPKRFETSVKIIPYLVGMLVGIGVFQSLRCDGAAHRRHSLGGSLPGF